MTQTNRKPSWLGTLIARAVSGIQSSLQVKMTLWTGATLAVVTIVLVAYSVITSRQTAIETAQQAALDTASSQARLVRINTDIPLDTARALAQAFKAVKDPANDLSLSRDEVNAMLRQVLIENPTFLGTYTLWEPNAFDGLDETYRGKEVHDETGRFIPYWVRGDDQSVSVIALEFYETPGIGDWYLLPRESKTEVVIAPLIYPIEGVDTTMASFVVPIIYNDIFYGIAGVDAPISFVQNIVDGVDLYNGKAQAVLMTSSGTLIGVRNKPELVNQPVEEIYPDFSDLQARINASEAFFSRSPDGQYLRVFSPVQLGKTNERWSFGLIIPFTEITAQATASAIRQVVISSILILLGLVLLWFLVSQVVRPVSALTVAAQEISQGNLNVIAKVQTRDETGVLANAFNLMVTRLRESFATLEVRVAERTQSLELAAEVGRSVSQVRALDVMLKDAAEIIRSRFDLYYVQVYLTNPAQNTLLLQSGTGLVGAELVGRGHKLPLDTGSINGLAAVEKYSVVISDTAASTTFRPNPLLPDTRSEMAVPLLVGNKIVGVLDLQSRIPDALNKDLLPAFEALAGQLAIAIQNAQLLAETDQARAEVERQARRLVRDSWEDYLDAVHMPEKTGFVYEKNVVKPLDEMVVTEPPAEGSALVSPITITGEQLGTLVVETADQSPQNVELVRIVARQVAQQIENLRLLDSAERYRSEAEAASRRSTIEGWRQYIGSTSGKKIGYMYDSNVVRPDDIDHRLYEAGLTMPIKIREETVGNLSLMGVESKDNASFELASAVADRLGAHIETLRLIEETRKSQVELDNRARHLAAVAAISTVSSREMDIDKMLHTVVHLTQRQFDLYHTHIFLFNEATSELKIAACGWKEGDIHEGTDDTAVIPLDREQSLVARAARTRQSVIVNNVRNDPNWLQNPLHTETESEMAVPLLIGEQLLGILDVQSERPDAFTEEDANIQTTLAAQVATSLQNARSYTQAQQQGQREAMLNAISQKIQGATSVEAVLQIAARELGHALGAPLTIAQLGVKDGNK